MAPIPPPPVAVVKTPPAKLAKPAPTPNPTTAIAPKPSGVTKATAAKAPVAKAAVVAAPFKITPMHKQRRYLKGIIYGKYGVGKTHLVGSAAAVPEMQDVLLVNAEKGDLTLETSDLPFGNIDLINIDNFRSFARVVEFIKLHCQARDAGDDELLMAYQRKLMGNEVKEPRHYQTVIIDSLAEIETFYMYQLLGINATTALDADTSTPEWSEYKSNLGTISRTMRTLRDIPIHALYTCASSWSQDEQKRRHHTLKLTGQLSDAVQGFVDLVGRLVLIQDGDGKITRRLLVQPSNTWDAKCRFSGFQGAYFDNPTMESIIEAVGLSIGEDKTIDVKK